MKTFAYIYSRTKYDNTGDYRFLADLSDSVCSDKTRSIFQNKILGLMKGLDDSQMLLVKESNCVLWGMACLNSRLAESYSKDSVGRDLRCFVGIVLPNYSGQALPYNLSFFSSFFNEVMDRLYESFTQSQVMDFAIDIDGTSSLINPQPFNNKLNTDNHYCRLFSKIADAESLIASCLSCPTDISIATNVADMNSVTTSRFYPLQNAVVRYNLQSVTEDIPVMHPCSKCGKEFDDLQDGLCKSCWRELHPPKPIKQKCTKCGKETEWLQQGMCNECYEKAHEKSIIHCPKCGKETSFLVKNKMCEKCYQKQRKRDRLFYVVLIIIMLITLCVKKCHRKTNTPQRLVPENHDERKKQLQLDSTMPFPKSKVDSSKNQDEKKTSIDTVNNKKIEHQ